MNQNESQRNALLGALVADAASMGLHWIYDQDHIGALASVGDVLFRQPDAAVYKDRKGYFAHAGRRAGELSHYGESARIVADLAQNAGYTPASHREAFLNSFGPCGTYVGYADRPTKALVARILIEGDSIPDDSGADDDQMPALCVVPGLFAAGASLDTVQQAARVISMHADGQAGVNAVYNCLNMLLDGASAHDGLVLSAKATGGELGMSMVEAMGLEGYQPLAAANRFGMPCHIYQGLPLTWHLLTHAGDFESAVRDNILCGGDTCGRAMALGAIAGALFGVPDSLVAQLQPGVVS